jgi:hypothetical protein
MTSLRKWNDTHWMGENIYNHIKESYPEYIKNSYSLIIKTSQLKHDHSILTDISPMKIHTYELTINTWK